MTQEHDHFTDTVADIPAYLVTPTDGVLNRARPIQFVTADDSAKIRKFPLDCDLCLSFASVSEPAEISENKTHIDRLWGPYCEAFFPCAPDNVSVITIDALRDEYRENDKGNLQMPCEVTKACFADHGPDPGENAKLGL